MLHSFLRKVILYYESSKYIAEDFVLNIWKKNSCHEKLCKSNPFQTLIVFEILHPTGPDQEHLIL